MPKPETTSLYTGHWVDGDGPIDSTILLVGQAPGETEALRERPFVGPAGQLLQRACEEAGIPWDSVRRTNTVRCRPPGNRPPTRDEIREYWPWLEAEIESMPRLRVIVALGNEALIAFSGRSGITRKRGREFRWRDRYWVLPAYHPAYVLRDRNQYSTLVADLRRAVQLATGTTVDPVGRITVGPPSLDPGRPVCVDVELGAGEEVRLAAVGQDPEHVWVVRDVDPSWSQWWVGHNVRADRVWLGNRLQGRFDDVMLLAHLTNENWPKGLKDLAAMHLGVEQYWTEVDAALRDPVRRAQIPEDVLARYCARDVACTLRLWERFRHLPDRVRAVYEYIVLPLEEVLLQLEATGVPIDVRYAQELVDRLEDEARRISASAPCNLDSSEQVAHLLYDQLGLQPPHTTPTTGRGSTDERALRSLGHPMAEAILEYRHRRKVAAMVRGWMREWVHPSYSQVGTVTGRLSGRNPNPQNLPTDPEVRRIVRAPDGYLLVWADYSTIELVVAAWLYGERSIVEAYEAGADLHSVTAEQLLGRPPADKEERKKFGKTPNFALLYMQGPDGFRAYAAKAGIQMSLDEAARIRSAWHALYPGIQRGWRRIAQELESQGYVESPSGRRRHTSQLTEAVNFPVQCTAAELTHVSAIIATRWMSDCRLILHVHDSLVFLVPAGRAERAAATLEGIMRYETPRYLRRHLGVELPFTPRVEISVGEVWS